MNQQKSAVVENSPQQPSPPGSPGVLYRWGVLMARRRRAVLAVWGLLLVVCAVAYPLLENRLGAMDFGVEGSESTEVDRLVARHFPQFGTEQAVIVLQSGAVTATDAEFRAAVARTITAATAVEGVVDVVGPYDGLPGSQISADGHVAIALAGMDGDMAERAKVARDLQDAIATTGDDSIDVGVTGYSAVQNAATELQNADLARAEAIGIPVALVLLVLALGALAAAAVPIAVAIAGMLTAVGVLFTLTAVTAFDSLTVAMATMVGLGVGIDYAMFIVSRFREELTHHTGPDHAAISGAVHQGRRLPVGNSATPARASQPVTSRIPGSGRRRTRKAARPTAGWGRRGRRGRGETGSRDRRGVRGAADRAGGWRCRPESPGGPVQADAAIR